MPNDGQNSDWQHRYLIAGFSLFLLGLVSGFLPIISENPRMALSAHMQVLINGIFLICAGLSIPFVDLTWRSECAAFFTLLYGTFANFIATVLAAIWNTGLLLNIHGNVDSTHSTKDYIVATLLISLSISMLFGVSIFLLGFIRKYRNKT